MSGHSQRPVYTGGSIDTFQAILRTWQAIPAGGTTTTTPQGPPPPPTLNLTTTAPAPTPFAQTQAGLTFAAQTQQDLLGIERTNAEFLARIQQSNALALQRTEQGFQREQLQRRFDEEARIRAQERERTRQANIRQLRVERQTTFSQLLASGDQVRAAIFALGFGPENDAFDVRARQLGTTVQELKGAAQFRATTEGALNAILERGGTNRIVTVGEGGVSNLGSAAGVARAFVQGGADVQTLLTSAFGVGSLREGEQPGISQARLTELIAEVVPRGVL